MTVTTKWQHYYFLSLTDSKFPYSVEGLQTLPGRDAMSAKQGFTQTCIIQSEPPKHFRVTLTLQTVHIIIPVLNIAFPL